MNNNDNFKKGRADQSSYGACERNINTGKFDTEACCAIFAEMGKWPAGAREACAKTASSANNKSAHGSKSPSQKSTEPSSAGNKGSGGIDRESKFGKGKGSANFGDRSLHQDDETEKYRNNEKKGRGNGDQG